MAQRIVIKILDRPFELMAESPEQEADIRVAAEKVNAKYYEYRKLFPNALPAELFSFIAVNGYVEAQEEKRRNAKSESEAARLHKDLKSYLEDIEI